ncbi:hypothetical protein C8R43DRAFT_1038242 [Mycena crocata]|nr:hypothetical protein C8R43DRAFT_1038242 [Mycena crocata]
MSSFPGAGQDYYFQESVFTASNGPSFPAAQEINNALVQSQSTTPEISATALPKCSVRGCPNPVEPSKPHVMANRKMCAACREKHRAYASTKRARRKAEKGLVSRLSAAGDAQGAEPATWTNLPQSVEAENSVATIDTQYPLVQATLPSSNAPQPQSNSWPIDPSLYAPVPAPSSSSTLAGALTLQPSSTSSGSIGPNVLVVNQPVQSPTRDEETQSAGISRGGAEHNQSQSEPTAPPLDSGVPATLGMIAGNVNERPRFCSVKGCKAIIQESMEDYPYKMCQPCRTRYRLYGITKRAKWKAEREAYDREVEGLRAKEDVRRAANGLPPLSDCPDELEAWELSIINEQLPAPPPGPPDAQSTGEGDVSMPMGPLDTRFSRQIPVEVTLPARMCTVSHCHNILPGNYRYKRCETHRIQNRWHSKLKRGREKIEKGFILPDGTVIVTPGPIKTKSNAEAKEEKLKKLRATEGKEVDGTKAGPSSSSENVEGSDVTMNNSQPIPRRSKSSSTCREDDCCNLIMPGTRWRTCDSCRALSRSLRQEQQVVERRQPEGISFVNILGGAGNSEAPSGSNISSSAANAAELSASGSSVGIVPIDVSKTPNRTAVYPPGYTSTSTLLTVNEPPPDKYTQPEPVGDSDQGGSTSSGVRPIRKYNKLPRYDKDGNLLPEGYKPPYKRKSRAKSALPQPIPAVQPSPYPYPPPPTGYPQYPYYMPPPYYGMPPPSGSAAPGQPLMYIPPYPYAMPPPPPHKTDVSSSSSSTAPAPLPYPYYPYALPPGYALPQHYPRASYPYPPPTGPLPPPPPRIAAEGNPSPYAVYKFHVPPAPPPSSSGPGPGPGPTFYKFKTQLKYLPTPEAPPPRKRMRSSELEGSAQEQRATSIPPPPSNGDHAPARAVTPSATPAPAPAPIPGVAVRAAAMDVDARDGEQGPSKPKARLCGSKTCNRALVSGTPGPLCDKCRTKMKKRQVVTKQRFKLEPKKTAMSVAAEGAEVPELVRASENMEQ